MTKTPTAPLDPKSAPPSRPQPAGAVGLKSGTRLGKYEVVGRLGIGGMAIVYKGYDPLLDRFVAIKQIGAHLAGDPKFLERFRKEAQILARLAAAEQASVVQIYELIEDARGLFIVTEFVDGQTLDLLIERQKGPMPEKLAMEILWHVAVGLRAIHEKDIIHRDIKPANIMVTTNHRCKITDFGVAARSGGKTSMTLGTTKYMAPELFGGEEVDGRVDIYSLGFIVYEMLVGQEKFRSIFADVVRDDRAESLRWMRWHTNRDMNAPALNQVNPKIPAALAAIVAKMTAKDPVQRFASADQLLETLKQHFTSAGQAKKTAVAAASRKKQQAQPGPSAEPAERKPEPIPDRSEQRIAQLRAGGGPKTTTLPKRKMRKRSRLILAGSLAGLGLAVLLTFVIVRSRQDSAYVQSAEDAYSAVEDKLREPSDRGVGGHWDAERLAEVRKGLEEVQKKYPDTAVANGWVPARLEWIDGRIALVNRDWKRAADFERIMWKRYNTKGMAKLEVHELREFSVDLGREQAWTKRIAQAEQAINDGLANMDDRLFTEAKEHLDRAQEIKKGEDLTEYFTKLEEAKSEYRYRYLMTQAETLIKNHQPDEAAKVLAQAQAVRKTPEIDRKLEALTRRKDYITHYNNYMSKAAANPAGAVQELEQAEAVAARMSPEEREAVKSVFPPENLGRQKERLKCNEAYQNAEKAWQQAQAGNPGQVDVALQWIARVFRYDPEHAPAKALQAKIGRNKQIEGFIRAGETAYGRNDWEEAKSNYAEAIKLLRDGSNKRQVDDLAQKVRECNYRSQFQQARQHRKNNDLDKAEQAFRAARSFTSDRSAHNMIDRELAGINVWREYFRLLAEADNSFNTNQPEKAYKEYRTAEKHCEANGLPRTEIQGRIREVQYHQYMMLAKSYASQNMWEQANLYCKQAASEKMTPELKTLWGEVAAHLGGSASQPE